MKYEAYLKPTSDSPKIHILAAWRRIKKNPLEKITYYSVDGSFTPMYARLEGNKEPHFCYMPGYSTKNNTEHGRGEGLLHSLIKHCICETKELYLKKPYKGHIYINKVVLKEIVEEFRFDDGVYVADIHATVEYSNDKELGRGDELIIEIWNTHKVDLHKKNYFRNKDIKTLEINVQEIKEKFYNDMDNGESLVKSWLRAGVKKQWLHHPDRKRLYEQSLLQKRERGRMNQDSHQHINNSTNHIEQEIVTESEILLLNITNALPNQKEIEIKADTCGSLNKTKYSFFDKIKKVLKL